MVFKDLLGVNYYVEKDFYVSWNFGGSFFIGHYCGYLINVASGMNGGFEIVLGGLFTLLSAVGISHEIKKRDEKILKEIHTNQIR